MHLVTLIANRALTGNYGHREAGASFTTDNRTAENLESRGLARRYFPPPPVKMTAPPENKMLTVEENKAAAPEPPTEENQFQTYDITEYSTGVLIPVGEPGPYRRKPGRPPGAKNKPRD